MNATMARLLAPRFLRAPAAAAALAAAACAHAPAEPRAEAKPAATAEANGRPEPQPRAFFTGSNLAQPVGRFGVPLGPSPVKIYYWRGDPTRGALPAFGRALPQIDLERQLHPDEKAAAQLDNQSP